MQLFAALLALFVTVPALDTAGKQVQLFDGRVTILVFVRTDCPISNRYAPELKRVSHEYAGRADFYLVYPDRAETAAMVQKHMAEYGYSIPALRDPNHTLIRLANARVTPEAAVFSASGKLLYHGRIDNRYIDFGKAMQEPTTRDLEEAVEAALDGKPLRTAVTRAIGCSLADVE